jgi:para-nitrobenzyl esterase
MLKLSELSSRRRKGTAPTLKTYLAVGFTLFAGTLLAPLQAYAFGGPVVQTNEGPVQGFQTKGITEFLGIPYAAPPVGNLRWRPPVAHARWKGVLHATAFGSNCPQNQNHIFAGPVNLTDEDCLFLNIFTPAVDNRRVKLPVIYWIHGGGNFEGESTDYDGSKLAAQGHTVVVSINYRLGPLGWLAVPALDSEGHLFGNYGLLDTQFGLKWVKQNIANFGGDPDNVTIGGQSAGSFDVEGNLVSPLAKGLFQRAILESLVTETQNLQTAEASGTTLANSLGCGTANGDTTNSQIAACLRAVSVQQITISADRGSLIGDGTILPLQPTTVSPTQPGGLYLAFQSGNYNHVPIISGNVEDEANFGLAVSEYNSQRITTPGIPFAPGGTQTPYSATQFASAIAAFPTTVTAFTSPLTVQDYVAAHYPLISSTPPGPQVSDDRLSSDESECQQHRINRVIATGPSPSPLYAYEFDDRTAPDYFPPLVDFVSLAYHTSDIQYLFPHFHGGPVPPSIATSLNTKQEILSDQLVAAWTNLAWAGNPNGTRNFPWPRYQGSKSSSSYLLENIAPSGLSRQTDAQFVAAHNCNFWDTYLTP